jgi:transposase
MLSFTGSLKVLLAVEPCDLRKSFNGLHGLVTERLGEDPRQGALFVFTNRRRTRLKMLCWDGTGLWILTKRLEQGTFSWPKSLAEGQTKLSLAPPALAKVGLKMNSVLMKTSELKMLWKLVKTGQRRPLSAADLALLLRIRFALQDYEAQSGSRRGQSTACKNEVG